MTSTYPPSQELLQTINANDRKSYHIEMTPPGLVRQVLLRVENTTQGIAPKTILEPGCGSGEFLHQLQHKYPYSRITGLETYPPLVSRLCGHYIRSSVQIESKSFLQICRKFDWIIGWPPQYTMLKSNVPRQHLSMFEGRPNSAILFLCHALDCLEPNGIVAFFMPESFLTDLNCSVLRDVICNHYHIVTIESVMDLWNHTTNTPKSTPKNKLPKSLKHSVLFVAQKKTPTDNSHFATQLQSCCILGTSQKIRILKSVCTDAHLNLQKCFMDVKCGSFSREKYKNDLTNDSTKTMWIGKAHLHNNITTPSTIIPEEKAFVNTVGINEPVIIVSRGDGKSKYQLQYKYIDMTDRPILIENHLLYVCYSGKVSREIKREKIQSLLRSLEDPRTHIFVETFFGNTTLNATELKYMLPVYTTTTTSTTTSTSTSTNKNTTTNINKNTNTK